jgi:hypothetical protein
MNNLKGYQKNIAISLLVLGLLFLVLSLFFVLMKEREDNINQYYKPEVDKNIEHSEYIGQVYMNRKYEFQIEFPKDWEISAGDNPHILQKAESGKNSIYISIFEFNKGLFKEYNDLGELNIKDLFSLEDYKLFTEAGIEQANSIVEAQNLKFLEYFNSEINNIPAYGSKISYKQEIDGTMEECVRISYDVMSGNIKYSITGVALTQNFISVQEDIIRSINSFEFIKD